MSKRIAFQNACAELQKEYTQKVQLLRKLMNDEPVVPQDPFAGEMIALFQKHLEAFAVQSGPIGLREIT